ncbi:hypothetical protein [Streptosporangium saharense]|uniref:Uncharacterized protein n=1 Tax=Streptosporangium saharense TaxID=1706840 RepID=A0A7W7VMB1_9ACTN|nr:hypothetical protein [Streptosporangium saharense]MBB4915075.1 hypothetical protein [Streptosporangium saharense]
MDDSNLIYVPSTPDHLTPNEHIMGSETDRDEIIGHLTAARALHTLNQDHPAVTFSLLSWVLLMGDETVKAVVRTGMDLMKERYRLLGLNRFLPTDRVWVGTRSTTQGAFGGFHYPNQGYRHVQMAALITRFGCLNERDAENLAQAGLDLLRAYAHDCLHFGSFREYARTSEGEVYRSCYGVNRRREDGVSYSVRDAQGAQSTRNLGVIMEGATDMEAATIARETAARLGITEPRDGIDRLAYRDVTGSITDDDLIALPTYRKDGVTADHYRAALRRYAQSVNLPYRRFLAEIGGSGASELHSLIVTAMISGRLAGLTEWLDRRHGEGAFPALFRSPAYVGLEPGVNG